MNKTLDVYEELFGKRPPLKAIHAGLECGLLIDKLPGVGQMPQAAREQVNDREMHRMLAIIRSMTPQERRFPDTIKGSRRKRIAAGSGTQVQDVNKLLKQFTQMSKMMKMMQGGGGKKMMQMMQQMKDAMQQQNQMQTFTQMMQILDNLISLSKKQEELKNEIKDIVKKAAILKNKNINKEKLKEIIKKLKSQGIKLDKNGNISNINDIKKLDNTAVKEIKKIIAQENEDTLKELKENRNENRNENNENVIILNQNQEIQI